MNGAGVAETIGAVVVPGLKPGNVVGLDEAVVPAVQKSPFPTMSEVPLEYRPRIIHQSEYLTGGELKKWDGATVEIRTPLPILGADGQVTHPVIGSHPMMDAKAALETLDAAKKAYDKGDGAWPQMPLSERIACTEKFLERMQASRSEVVNGLMWEICKVLPDAQKEFDRTVEYVRDSIKELRKMEEEGKAIASNSGIASKIERNAIGVTLCVGPSNYPLNETFTTMLPALLMGNTVVMKTPKLGVLFFEPIMKAFQESYPPGVVNFLYGEGREVITPIMRDGGIDALAFIGSVGAARAIIKEHPEPHRLRLILGLGAKNAFVVMPDANLDLAVDEGLIGALSNTGLRCTQAADIMVHESIAPEFAKRLAAKVAALPQGMPWVKGVKVPPLAEPGKVEYMQDLVADAVVHGARVMNPGGGEAADTLFTPAVLYPVSRDAKISVKEQFGPVVPITPFRDTGEAIERIKNSPFGQQLAVFGQDADALAEFARRTRNFVARINENSQCQRGPDVLPFGARRSSGMTSLSIRQALEAFSIETVYAGKDNGFTRDWLAEAA